MNTNSQRSRNDMINFGCDYAPLAQRLNHMRPFPFRIYSHRNSEANAIRLQLYYGTDHQMMHFRRTPACPQHCTQFFATCNYSYLTGELIYSN